MNSEDKIKTILDRECYENWLAKRCQQREENRRHLGTPCWVCSRNAVLAKEISEVSCIASSVLRG